jgi:hypothetical protein
MPETPSEFYVWENGVPVIIISGDKEFNVWENNAPVVDQFTTETPTPPVVSGRRRTFEF